MDGWLGGILSGRVEVCVIVDARTIVHYCARAFVLIVQLVKGWMSSYLHTVNG